MKTRGTSGLPGLNSTRTVLGGTPGGVTVNDTAKPPRCFRDGFTMVTGPSTTCCTSRMKRSLAWKVTNQGGGCQLAALHRGAGPPNARRVVETVWVLGRSPSSAVPTPVTPRRPLTVEPRLSPAGGQRSCGRLG